MRIACFGGYSDNAGKWVVIGSFLLGQFRMVLFAILRNLNGFVLELPQSVLSSQPTRNR